MGKKTKGAKRDRPRTRQERRFEPLPSAKPAVVYLVGALGALAMGAGAWGQFGSWVHDGGPGPFKYAPYILAFGALLVGIAIWIGSSGEPAVRVGDGGVAVERGGVRRLPWYLVDRIEWRKETIRVAGKDEAGGILNILVPAGAHPQAAAWIIREARERVPGVVDVPDDATLPPPLASAGETLTMEPPQVVGQHCAASGAVIAYEPDARVCPRCERVYHKAHTPEACACGASLASLRSEAKTA